MTTPYTTHKTVTLDDIERMRHLMLSQDSRATAFPIYEVRDCKDTIGVDTRFVEDSVPIVVINDGEGNLIKRIDELTLDEAEKIIVDLEEDSCTQRNRFIFQNIYHSRVEDMPVTPDELIKMVRNHRTFDIYDTENDDMLLNFTKTGMLSEPSIVTFCFTEEAANRYIEENRHDLNRPHVFVSSAYRNRELQAVMQLLVDDIQPSLSPAPS